MDSLTLFYLIKAVKTKTETFMTFGRLGIPTHSSPANVHQTFKFYARKHKLAVGISMETLLPTDRSGLATAKLSADAAKEK